jgi:hypothetical protein
MRITLAASLALLVAVQMIGATPLTGPRRLDVQGFVQAIGQKGCASVGDIGLPRNNTCADLLDFVTPPCAIQGPDPSSVAACLLGLHALNSTIGPEQRR